MNFNLTAPCDNCPFRTDCPKGWLGAPRAHGIASGLFQDKTFACHKTTDLEDDESIEFHSNPDEQHCAGALIFLEKQGFAHQLMWIAERLGFYDAAKLKMTSPVFKTSADFIRHHTGKTQRKKAAKTKKSRIAPSLSPVA